MKLLITIGALLVGTSSIAQAGMAEIEITNLTSGQNFSPAAVVIHKPSFSLFSVGTPASSAVWKVAEDGDVTDAKALTSNPLVREVVIGEGIPAGQKKTIRVTIPYGYRASLIAMLATSNDAFVGVKGLTLPSRSGGYSVTALAFDAGSERNSESCLYVPGPPCSAHGVRMVEGSEGFVSVHNGIHGVGDLPAVRYDFNNPVANIHIKQVD